MTAIPKSAKLLRASETTVSEQPPAPELKVYKVGEKVPIKPVKCYNDFVAILQFKIDSPIILTSGNLKNEGMVVGIGPGIPTANGGRTPSQLKLGDTVTFYGNPTTALEPKNGVYAGQRVVIVSERSVICAIPAVPFEIVDELTNEQQS